MYSIVNLILESKLYIWNRSHMKKKWNKNYRERHVDTLTKVNFALSAHLMDFVNSTPNFIFTSSWGFPMPKGGFNGMIGQLIRQEAEIGGKH